MLLLFLQLHVLSELPLNLLGVGYLHLMILLHIPSKRILLAFFNLFRALFLVIFFLNMSTPSCFLLFLLCLSLHACSGRRLGAVDNKNYKIDNKLHFSIKNDTKKGFKNNSVEVLQAKSSSPSKELRSVKEESIEESHADDGAQKLEDAEVNQKTVENEKEKSSGASVSWRVPQKKHGEKHPCFNLDYSPPKTHPPSHN